MPIDAKELMLLAARSNGLASLDLQPWHLKASYQLLDEQGAVTDAGTIEEWWAGPHKSKHTYTARDVSQTVYWTDTGGMRTGAAKIPSSVVPELAYAFVAPLPDSAFLKSQSFLMKERDLGTVKLDCVTTVVPPPANSVGGQPAAGPTYCFNAEKPMLRISIYGAGKTQVMSDRLGSFQGRYVAEDLKLARSGKLVASAHLETLELLKPIDEAMFTPPADAVAIPKKINLSAGVAQGILQKKVNPIYPFVAKDLGVQGTVVLQAVISKEGHVTELKVISGAPELQQAALDAVKQWEYSPYLLNGDPVEVNTTINVVFSLAR